MAKRVQKTAKQIPAKQKTGKTADLRRHKGPARSVRKGSNTKASRSGKRKLKRIWRKLGITFLAVVAVLGGVLIISMIVLARELPDPDKINARQIELSTEIYDRDGGELYRIHGDVDRSLVKFEDIPKDLIDATVAVEDKNFYHHIGFSVSGIIRAALSNVTGGGKGQGGSTITQQFVKNAILTPEKTYTRKFKELVLSLELEIAFSKEEILQMYLNEIPYGSTAYGAQAAARMFFGKDLSELTLAENAYLAGLPQAPTRYSPFINPENGKARQEHVLDRMVSEGYIAEEKAENAKSQELTFKTRAENINAPHFVFYVIDYLEEMAGLDTREIEGGGLKITTSLAPRLQQIAEEEIAARATANEAYGINNAALAAMNPQTGEVLAMVGSKDFFGEKNDQFDPQVNVMTSWRQPGSSFKPIEYTEAFDKGYTPETMLFDISTSFGTMGNGEEYRPANYSGGFAGPVSMRHALQQSLNIPAIKTYYLANPSDVSTMANHLGYSNFEEGARYDLSTALGAREVKGLEHLSAFATFANNGKKVPINPVLKVEDSKGNILYQADYNETKVMDANTAHMITNVLSDNNARTWGRAELVLPDRPVAAKTGTSNKKLSNGSIAPNNVWTIGYTPSLATVAWAGNNDGSVLSTSATGLTNASPLWQAFMHRATEGQAVEDFPAPEIQKIDKPMLNGDLTKEETVIICHPSQLLATDDCPPTKSEEKTYREIHTVLYYVNRLRPKDDIPERPEDDPQFNLWEDAVQEWAEDEDGYGKAPTETDTDHDAINWPNLIIKAPKNNASITENHIDFDVSVAKKKFNVSRLELYIDEQLIATDSGYPFDAYFPLPSNLKNGLHEFKLVVYDEVDNSDTKKLMLDIDLPSRAKSSIYLLNPNNGTHLDTDDFPLTVRASTSYEGNIKKVNFYYRTANGNPVLIGSSASPTSQSIYQAVLNTLAAGNYSMYATLIPGSGSAITSNSVSVTVQEQNEED